jgi:hypothetical protein
MISTPKLFFHDSCKNCSSSTRINAEKIAECKNCASSLSPTEKAKVIGTLQYFFYFSEILEIEKQRDALYARIIAQIPVHIWMISISQIISGICTDKKALFNSLVKKHLEGLLVSLASTYPNKVCWFLLASHNR